jgi:ribose 5-phosphate isomerase B
MKVYLGSDHAGFALKKVIAKLIDDMGHEPVDCGAFEEDPSDDYPVFVARAIKKLSADVAEGKDSKAVIFGKSGQGEAMVANRTQGIRAVVFYGGKSEIPSLSREHNDSNVLSLGAGFLGVEEAKGAVTDWLNTSFTQDERHVRRIRQIDELTKN